LNCAERGSCKSSPPAATVGRQFSSAALPAQQPNQARLGHIARGLAVVALEVFARHGEELQTFAALKHPARVHFGDNLKLEIADFRSAGCRHLKFEMADFRQADCSDLKFEREIQRRRLQRFEI